MEMLLASDKLKVASEDTVLFTALAYAQHVAAQQPMFGAYHKAHTSRRDPIMFGGPRGFRGFSTQELDQRAVDKLAPLVRCPHLSELWLSAAATSVDADRLVLRGLRPQLRRLLLLKAGSAASNADCAEGIPATDILKQVPDMPPSWLLPVRDIQLVPSARVQWEVDVAAIRQAAQESASGKQCITLKSPSSSLLGGVMWRMQLCFDWDAGKQCSTIELYARARNLLAGAFCSCTYNLECLSAAAVVEGGATCSFSHRNMRGNRDAYQLGTMPGGFDELGWAGKGLPTTGSIVLQLTVKDVGVPVLSST